jgi:signal transduction histidine kinase
MTTHAPARVLIVDDETGIRTTLCAFLQASGYEAEAAADAPQALERLAASAWNVVVSDIVMPGLSGVDLLKSIHARDPDVQVIMMTGNPSVETAAETVRTGACDYLIKPFSKAAFLHAVARAVTIKTLLDDRRRLEAEMREAREAAEAANRAKSDFLANMNHELRTPLTAIIGFSELLRDPYFGPLNAKQDEYVRDIHDSGRHLLALITDIMDLTRIDAGKISLTRAAVPVAELLKNSLALIREKCLAHGIRLALELPDEIRPLAVDADERRIKQVLFNLLSNAVKFTPDGGSVTLSARLATESSQPPAAGVPPDRLLVAVTDTGIGISPENQALLFREFQQVGNHLTGKPPGTGLGLALVKRFVALHGGRVWVESAGEGRGSTFRFTIPLKDKERPS